MSLKRKLPIAIALLVTLSMLISQFLAYFSGQKIMISESKAKLATNSEKTGLFVDGLVKGEMTNTQLVSTHSTFKDLLTLKNTKSDEEFFGKDNALLTKANSLLKASFDKVKEHEHFFVADKNGLIIADSNEANVGKINIKERDYFKEAIQGKDAVSNTIVSKVDGKIVIVFATPIKDNAGSILGVLANSVYADFFVSKLSDIKIGTSGYVYILDNTGTTISHPVKEKVNTKPGIKEVEAVASQQNSSEGLSARELIYNYGGKEKIASYVKINGVNWTLIATTDYSDIQAPVRSLMTNLTLILLVCTAVAVIVGHFISKMIVNPISQLLGSMTEVSSGNLNVVMKIKSKDEFGTLSVRFNDMTGKIKGLIENMRGTISVLEQSAEELGSSSDTTARSIEETTITIQEVARAIENQAGDTQQASEKVNELGDQVEAINEKSLIIKNNSEDMLHRFEENKQILEKLIDITEQSVGEIEKVSEITRKLDSSSVKIGDITKVISSIAEQTNLLALNASIEAARAGEAGRGFAVVAEEIRKLAEQSSASVSEITEIIKETQNYSLENTRTVDVMKGMVGNQNQYVLQTQKSFDTVMESVVSSSVEIENINNAIERINGYKDEVVSNIQNLTASTEEISASVQQVSATTEEQSSMVEQLTSMIDNLNELSKALVQAASIFKI